jgi:hypothetical protein
LFDDDGFTYTYNIGGEEEILYFNNINNNNCPFSTTISLADDASSETVEDYGLTLI